MASITIYVPAHGQLLTVAARPGEPQNQDRELRFKEFPPKATREAAKTVVDGFPSNVALRRIIERTYVGEGEVFEDYKQMIDRSLSLGVEVMELGSMFDRQTVKERHYRYPDGMERIDVVTEP